MIRAILTERFGTVVAGAFHFHAPCCDRVVSRVLMAMVEDPPAQSFTQGSYPGSPSLAATGVRRPFDRKIPVISMGGPGPSRYATGYSWAMLDPSQQQALVTRLNRIEGQIRGIRRMVQEPRRCIDILQQLAAAEAAMNRVSAAVLTFHVRKCVPEGAAHGDEERSRQLGELVDIFDRFVR
jgi:DNA-binding FrmR family transcriptional regulator